jgi:DNA polymerase-3 subunit epsilon
MPHEALENALNFLCLDVETANESAASICQIGIATFIDDEHRPELDIEVYVDPEDYFLDDLIEIHGISEKNVAGAPTYPEVHQILTQLLSGHTVLGHSHFDRVSLARASSKYALVPLEVQWLDTLRVARRAWPERRGNGGHGLRALADHCGIHFKHHSAVQDAWCAGEVFLRACAVSGLTLNEWLLRVNQPIAPRKVPYPDGNPDGHLFGEIVVFTGQLSLPRAEMADLASFAGCRVDDGVTKHTTLVVVGDQDVRRLNGATIGAKHRKARDLIAKGKPLRVVSEADLMLLLAH